MFGYELKYTETFELLIFYRFVKAWNVKISDVYCKNIYVQYYSDFTVKIYVQYCAEMCPAKD